METHTLDATPPIHASTIALQRYRGMIETGEGELHLVSIHLMDGRRYAVAGGACNAGLLPTYARAWDKGWESLDEALQEMVADIEAVEHGEHPSGELLSWHGSLVI